MTLPAARRAGHALPFWPARAGRILAVLAPLLAGWPGAAAAPAPAAPSGPAATSAPAAAAGPAAPAGHSDAELHAMADQLATRLAAAPADLDGWVLLARTRATLHDWDGAVAAMHRALALSPGTDALHAQLGEILTLRNDGVVTPEAQAEFGHAQDDPRARFYTAVAHAQAGDRGTAASELRALLADTPDDAPWRGMVQEELAAAAAPAAAPGAAGSTPEIEAVHDFLSGLPAAQHPAAPAPAAVDPADPADLQAQLGQHPRDARIWLALARAYQARAQASQARETLRRANAAMPGNADLLLAYADALETDIHGDDLPAPLLTTLRQLLALDADQPDALWYLGIDAAGRGDAHAARKFWLRLSHGLPAGSQELAAVQARLAALK